MIGNLSEAVFERRRRRSLERRRCRRCAESRDGEPLGGRGVHADDHAEHGVELRAARARAARAVHGLGEVVRLVEHHHRVLQCATWPARRRRRARRRDAGGAKMRSARGARRAGAIALRTRPALHARARQILDVRGVAKASSAAAAAAAPRRLRRKGHPFSFSFFDSSLEWGLSGGAAVGARRRLFGVSPAFRQPSRCLLGGRSRHRPGGDEPRRGRGGRRLAGVAVAAASAGDGPRFVAEASRAVRAAIACRDRRSTAARPPAARCVEPRRAETLGR